MPTRPRARSGDDATAVTEAPRMAPSLHRGEADAAAAPSTISSSPVSHPRERSEHVVGGAMRDAEGGQRGDRRRRPGRGATVSAPTTTSSANAPKSPVPKTRSPTTGSATPSATSVTTPANSLPGNERRRHLDLVLVRDEQHVGVVDRGRVRPGPAPARPEHRRREVLDPHARRARRTPGRRPRAPQLTGCARPARASR